MMHGKIDLNLFIVLRAVYDQGSITKAARHLHLTQPAVSHALGRLRVNFKDELFVRHGRRMVPTPLCQKIIAPVSQAVDALEQTVQGDVTFDITASARQLKLGLRDILESTFLPTLMPDLIAHTPNISVCSRQVTWPEIEPLLTKKELDLVIDVLVPTSEDILSQFVCNERFVVVSAPNNPYLKNPTIKGYAAAQHILVTLKDSKLDSVELALAQHNMHRNIALQCEHYFAAVHVASQCSLLLTMPERYAYQLSEKFDIIVSPLPFEVPLLPVYMYWHKKYADDLVNKWMRSKLVEVTDLLGLK